MSDQPSLGRNEPCHCGSGKKFKRCHGIDSAPKLGVPKPAQDPAAAAGFDPSSMDPDTIQKMQQMMQRLPRGQMQKLQALMQKAMAGKDISRDAGELERTLPPDIQQLFIQAAAQMGQTANPSEGTPPAVAETMSEPMSEEEARKIVEQAVKDGKISSEEAKNLTGSESSQKSSGWKGLFKKK